MWDFLREQFEHIPVSLRTCFVAAIALAGINRIAGIDISIELNQCLSQTGAIRCIGLGIASAPYVVLGAGLSHFVVSRAATSIRRRRGSGRREEPPDSEQHQDNEPSEPR